MKTTEPGSEQVLGHVGMGLGVEPPLGQRAVAGGLNELLELRVRHLVTVDPKAVDADDMGEALLGLMALGAHLECAAGDECHAGGVAFLGRQAGVGGAASRLRAVVRVAGCESADHDAGQHRAEPEGADQQAASHHRPGPPHWNAKTRFQSFFMSTTVHLFSAAASSALSSRPKWDWRS